MSSKSSSSSSSLPFNIGCNLYLNIFFFLFFIYNILSISSILSAICFSTLFVCIKIDSIEFLPSSDQTKSINCHFFTPFFREGAEGKSISSSSKIFPFVDSDKVFSSSYSYFFWGRLLTSISLSLSLLSSLSTSNLHDDVCSTLLCT